MNLSCKIIARYIYPFLMDVRDTERGNGSRKREREYTRAVVLKVGSPLASPGNLAEMQIPS
jgi:hypothetical protein